MLTLLHVQQIQLPELEIPCCSVEPQELWNPDRVFCNCGVRNSEVLLYVTFLYSVIMYSLEE